MGRKCAAEAKLIPDEIWTSEQPTTTETAGASSLEAQRRARRSDQADGAPRDDNRVGKAGEGGQREAP